MSKIDVRRETRGNYISSGIRLSQRRDADGTSFAQRRDADGTSCAQRRDADGTSSPNGETPSLLQFVDEDALQINGVLAEVYHLSFLLCFHQKQVSE